MIGIDQLAPQECRFVTPTKNYKNKTGTRKCTRAVVVHLLKLTLPTLVDGTQSPSAVKWRMREFKKTKWRSESRVWGLAFFLDEFMNNVIRIL